MHQMRERAAYSVNTLVSKILLILDVGFKSSQVKSWDVRLIYWFSEDGGPRSGHAQGRTSNPRKKEKRQKGKKKRLHDA